MAASGLPAQLLPDARGDIEISAGRREARRGQSLPQLLRAECCETSRARRSRRTMRASTECWPGSRGMTPSQIDGALRSRIPGADLYLFNPAGVFFGNGASLDVDGSLYVSSADALRLSDGNVLRADPAGWVGPEQRAAVGMAVLGTLRRGDPHRGLAPGSRCHGARSRSSAGPIEVAGRAGPASGEPVLVAPGGRIDLVAVGSGRSRRTRAQRVGCLGESTALADVSISANAQLTTAGERSGTVRVRASHLRDRPRVRLLRLPGIGSTRCRSRSTSMCAATS